jgi:hypothetical protein
MLSFIDTWLLVQAQRGKNFDKISISRCCVLAHCRGFGTCGWKDMGYPSTRPRLWDPLPWRHYSRALPHWPVGCPSMLARGVWLKLPIKVPMEDAGVIKLYEPSPTPCLYVADVMVGRVPLMPLFLAGNSTPTIPHTFSKRKDSGFPYGCADAAATDGQRGSNVYEVNQWLWQFGLGKTRLGGLTIEETTERTRKDAVSNAWHKRAAATVRHRKANPA